VGVAAVYALRWTCRVAPTFVSQVPKIDGRSTESSRPSEPAVSLKALATVPVGSSSSITADNSLSTQAMATLHLSKGIVGTGMLALPSGMAAVATSVGDELSVPISMVLLVAVTMVSAYSYREVGRCAAETRSETFAQTFQRSTGGNAMLAAAVTALNCLGGCICFSLILGNSAAEMLHAASLEPQVGAEWFHLSVNLAVSFGLLWPACARLDFRSMEWTSVVGVSASFTTALVMLLRAFDGSYSDIGNYAAQAMPVSPSPDQSGAGGPLCFLALLANAFIAHQSAPRLRNTIEDSFEVSNGTASSTFDVVVAAGFALSAVFYSVVALTGYLTFGHGVDGNVLDSYAADDSLAAFARLATVACVICSFPQMLMGLRDSLNDLFGKSADVWLNTPTLLAIIAVLASLSTDLASALSMQGALLGSLLVYVLPAMMIGGRQAAQPEPTQHAFLQSHDLLFGTGCVLGVGGLALEIAN